MASDDNRLAKLLTGTVDEVAQLPAKERNRRKTKAR
jgi:hypothetical protein